MRYSKRQPITLFYQGSIGVIPLQLMLRNFLSYGATTQTIDFEPYHLICFTGKNGHGKSALLDAITWALWGQARKVGGINRSDEHLMRLGQTHMMVTLDFLCNKNRYRVNRELVLYANKKSHTQLSLGVYKEETHAYVSLNEKTSRATQEKITELLGIDYEGCVNSIFLRQGQSNEFSKRAPQERKEILASMLGLNHYEELRKRALEKSRTLTRDREQLIHLIEVLNKEGISGKELDQNSALIIEQLSKNAEQTHFFSQKQIAGEEKRQVLLIKQQEIASLLQQATRISKEFSEKKNLFLSEIAAWREGKRQQKNHYDMAVLEQELEQVSAALAKQKAREQRTIELKEKLVIITAEEHRLRESLLNNYTQQCSLYEKKVEREKLHHEQLKQKKIELRKTLNTLTDTLTTISRTKATLISSLQEREFLLKELSTKEALIKRLSFFAQRWQLRLEKNEQEQAAYLVQEKALPSSTPQCPLCLQTISPSKHQELHQEMAKKKERLKHHHKRLTGLQQQLGEKRAQEETKRELILKKIALLEKASIEHSVLSKRALDYQDDHTKTVAFLQAAEEEESLVITRLKNALAELEAWHAHKESFFNADKTVAHLQKERTLITQELDQCPLGADNSSSLHQKHIFLLQQKEAALRINRELDRQDERRASISALSAQLKNLKKELMGITKAQNEAPQLDQELATTNRALEHIRQHLQALAQQKDALLLEKGSLEQQKNQLEQRVAAQKIYVQQKADSERHLNDYQLISSALSKNGLQALIIENAIPEIEAEANALLAQLTDNQAHIIFESIRDLKSGGTKETLDIKISDALGIRPYELFSGGEAFRIDFAIRIAISKLLARRSGTSLQTLIIDEGFGSQDEEGLTMIMEALYKIQDDFEKIIVVSHLTEMKTEFPTNFLIQKGAGGSTVTVLQQG